MKVGVPIEVHVIILFHIGPLEAPATTTTTALIRIQYAQAAFVKMIPQMVKLLLNILKCYQKKLKRLLVILIF